MELQELLAHLAGGKSPESEGAGDNERIALTVAKLRQAAKADDTTGLAEDIDFILDELRDARSKAAPAEDPDACPIRFGKVLALKIAVAYSKATNAKFSPAEFIALCNLIAAWTTDGKITPYFPPYPGK